MKKNALIFWDLLTWLLVAFPFLTGGVWYKRPHLLLELTELSIPVLIITLLGALLKIIAHIPLEQASCVRFFKWLWTQWVTCIQQSPMTTLLLGTLSVGSLLATAALFRHWAFGSGSADLGIFTNAIWNLTHRGHYVSSVKGGMNLFADHQSPLFWGLVPLFALFPKSETLLIAQAFGLASGGLAMYWIGLSYLSPPPTFRKLTHPERSWILAALPILYWAYLPMRNANQFDFHPEVFMLPLFLFAIAGLQSPQWRSRVLGGLAFGLALLAKESAGPVAVGLGLAWLLGAGPSAQASFLKKWAWIAIPLGITVFYVDTKIVPPLFGQTYAYQALYPKFAENLGGLLVSPFTHPLALMTQLCNGARLKFLFWTLAPLAFLPLLNWRTCIAALPGYCMLFLSSGNHRVSLIYHYAIEPSIGLFWALPVALQRVDLKKTSVLLWILFWGFFAFGRSELFQIRWHRPTSHHTLLRTQILPSLHPTASFAASEALVPHLASRPWIDALPNVDTPVAVDCVIYDASVNQWPLTESRIHAKLHSDRFEILWSCGPTTLFRRTGSKIACLLYPPECPLE